MIALIAAEGEELPAKPVSAPLATDMEGSEGEPPAQSVPSQSRVPSPVAARMAAQHGIDLADVPAVGGRISREDIEAHMRAAGAGVRVLASPKARRLARERGIDLASLAGNGPQGAVLAADVPLAVQPPTESITQPQPVPAPAASPPDQPTVSRMWQIMAQRLTASWTSVPHFYLVREVDATGLQGWRSLLASKTPDRVNVTYTDLLTKLTALSLARFPRLNASWRDGEILFNPDINIGLAVAVPEGLLVPVVHKADQLQVQDIAARRTDLVARANRAALLPDDFAGGTFTISNLGMYGVDAFNAIVNPPQAAILAVARITDRVVAVDGQPAVRPMLTLTLSCDHRAVDGVMAAQFLDALAALIEEPLRAL